MRGRVWGRKASEKVRTDFLLILPFLDASLGAALSEGRVGDADSFLCERRAWSTNRGSPSCVRVDRTVRRRLSVARA